MQLLRMTIFKKQKAKELGIPILTEEEFLKGLEGKDNNADQSTE